MTHFDVAHLEEQFAEYQEDMGSPGFWDDLERAQKVTQKSRSTEARINHFKKLVSRSDDLEVLIDLADEEDDSSLVPEISTEIEAMKKDLESLKLTTLLSGEYDQNDCILALHAGAGGTEAQDWTQMLYRMYTRFAERMGLTVKGAGLLGGRRGRNQVRHLGGLGRLRLRLYEERARRAPAGAHLAV